MEYVLKLFAWVLTLKSTLRSRKESIYSSKNKIRLLMQEEESLYNEHSFKYPRKLWRIDSESELMEQTKISLQLSHWCCYSLSNVVQSSKWNLSTPSANVCEFMSLFTVERGSCGKSCVQKHTSVWSTPAACLQMILETTPVCEPLGTMRTAESVGAVVCIEVHLVALLIRKLLGAHWALKHLCICVHFEVELQTGHVGECLVADWTLKRLCVVVHVHVPHKVPLGHKALRADGAPVLGQVLVVLAFMVGQPWAGLELGITQCAQVRWVSYHVSSGLGWPIRSLDLPGGWWLPRYTRTQHGWGAAQTCCHRQHEASLRL